MEHTKSSFYFTSNNDTWQVDYSGLKEEISIYLNNELYWYFKEKPNTKTENPTKTQAKEIISAARKLYKEKYKLRDDRDKKLSKLI